MLDAYYMTHRSSMIELQKIELIQVEYRPEVI